VNGGGTLNLTNVISGGSLQGGGQTANQTAAANNVVTYGDSIAVDSVNNPASNGTISLQGVNSYTGGTTLASGVVVNADVAELPGAGGAFGLGGTLTFTGGTLQYSALNNFDYSPRFSIVAGQSFNIDTNSRNVTYATGLAGAGSALTKIGAGTLTLSANSTYTGATTVNAGTLLVSGSLSGSSPVTVGNSASLLTAAILAGNGKVGNVTVGAAAGNSAAEIEPSNGGTELLGSGTTLTTGVLTIGAGSDATVALQIGRSDAVSQSSGAGDSSDHILAGGSVLGSGGNLLISFQTGYSPTANDVLYLIINGANSESGTFGTVNGVAIASNQFSYLGETWAISYNASDALNEFSSVTAGSDTDVAIELVSVPEPGTWAAVISGFGMLIVVQRMRRRQTRA
jgi:autotransporter-associated beta strand protein